MEHKPRITIETSIQAPVAKVWQIWSDPEHIKKWNNASEDWHTPHAQNDLSPGGKFSSRMEAKDGSFGFDFGGTYDEVILHQKISYTMDDGRKVIILFEDKDGTTAITEIFEAEQENPLDMQQSGWQAILDNFRSYVEKSA